ncbi:MAG: GAF domain-containing protein [Candidatus Sulfotelmatobacter sp.]
MEHYSILDRSSSHERGSAAPAAGKELPPAVVNRPAYASVSAAIADANAHLPKPSDPAPRFPGEDGGRSLAEMAYRDLDAALQLLADRAQYITGASGAAIALRRGAHKDMLCRASAGENAPELGALLSMEYGLSGECVRTRQVLRCDDAERDTRVNREACRDLGIASVVVMPVVNDDQVLGVFELLSGKPRAFEERDIAALQRLSEMVETAVKHAVAAQVLPEVEEESEELDLAEIESQVDEILAEAEPEAPQPEPPAPVVKSAAPPTPPAPELPATKEGPPPKREEAAAPKKPLFWSAALRTQANSAPTPEAAESMAAPPVLRNLQKCKACGFPVSQGRTYCVECEEKQWRTQRHVQSSAAAAAVVSHAPHQEVKTEPASVPAVRAAVDTPEIPVAEIPAVPPVTKNSSSTKTEEPIAAAPSVPAPADIAENISANEPIPDNSTLFLSSVHPSESWLAANKYVLGTLLVVAIAIAVIAWLR